MRVFEEIKIHGNRPENKAISFPIRPGPYLLVPQGFPSFEGLSWVEILRAHPEMKVNLLQLRWGYRTYHCTEDGKCELVGYNYDTSN